MKNLDFSKLVETYNKEFAEDDLTFDWPETTPTEVRFSIGVDKFDSSDDKYYLPVCCVRVKAIRVWGLVVCAIESIVVAICLLLDLIHLGSSLPGCTNLTPYLLFLTALTEIGIFVAFKIMFVYALKDHNTQFLKAHLAFQYATMVVLCINICYAFAIIYGPRDAKEYFASYTTGYIEAAGWLSLAFLPAEVYLRMCTNSVSRLIIDYEKFCHQLIVHRWQYRKKCHFSFSSIAQDQMELAARLAANRLFEEKQRQKVAEEEQRLEEERQKAVQLAEEDRAKHEQERLEAEQKLAEEQLKLQEQIKKTEALEAARVIEEIEHQQQEVGVTYENEAQAAAQQAAANEATDAADEAVTHDQSTPSSPAESDDEEAEKYPSSLEGSDDESNPSQMPCEETSIAHNLHDNMQENASSTSKTSGMLYETKIKNFKQ